MAEKATEKKAAAKKITAKKAAAKKARTKTTTPKKAIPKKAAPKQAAPKQVAAKKATTKRAAARKAAAKKATAKRAAAKVPARKVPAKKSRAREPDAEGLQAHIDKALALSGKTDTARMYKAVKFYFDPQWIYLERVDKGRPSLFVTNHGNWGWEGGVIPSAIHEVTGMLPRLLTDSTLMQSRFADTLMDLGMVLANRQVCSALMDAGESILVFPGGAREGAKRRGEQYKLLWEGRTGFVRMAIQHGFTITPVANIGPDEMWDIRWDSDDMQGTWVESLLRRLFPDENIEPELIPPIPKGLLGTLIPRPERIFLAFGEPFDTRPYAGRENDEEALDEIKGIVQARLEDLIKDALLERARRRGDMHWLRRRLTRY